VAVAVVLGVSISSTRSVAAATAVVTFCAALDTLLNTFDTLLLTVATVLLTLLSVSLTLELTADTVLLALARALLHLSFSVVTLVLRLASVLLTLAPIVATVLPTLAARLLTLWPIVVIVELRLASVLLTAVPMLITLFLNFDSASVTVVIVLLRLLLSVLTPLSMVIVPTPLSTDELAVLVAAALELTVDVVTVATHAVVLLVVVWRADTSEENQPHRPPEGMARSSKLSSRIRRYGRFSSQLIQSSRSSETLQRFLQSHDCTLYLASLAGTTGQRKHPLSYAGPILAHANPDYPAALEICGDSRAFYLAE
jgi:hypothetical protein